MDFQNGEVAKYVVEGNHVEIYFSGVPSEKIRETMKICGWHWFGKKKCWSNHANHDNILWAKSLCEELNPKKVSRLYKLKKCNIGMGDLIVRSNSSYCNKHHEIEDMAGEIQVRDSNGTIYSYLVPIVYCKTCNVYYMLEGTYLALKEKGRIMCSILSYKAYQNSKSAEYGE